MRRKYFNLLAMVMFVLSITFFSSSASAEIKIYTGVGKYYLESENETLGYAEEQAKILAELNALEQTQVYVDSHSRVRNFELDDDFISIAAGILNVLDVAYFVDLDFDDVLIVKAVATVEIDEDRIAELLEREIAGRRFE